MDDVRKAYIQRHIDVMPPVQRQVLEALLVFDYSLTPVKADADEPARWIVMHKRGRMAYTVDEANINSRWMLHVVVEDIDEVEKYAVQQMWSVVDLYKSLATQEGAVE